MISANILKSSSIFSGLAIMLLAVFTITSLALAPNAYAKKIEVEFDDLHITQEHDRLVVDYSIRSKDWKELRKRDITPTLDVYTDQARHRRPTTLASERLRQRSGTLVIRRTQLHPRQDVFIELNGSRGKHYISRIEYGRQRGQSIQLAVNRPAYRPAPPVHNSRPRPVGPPRTVVVHQPAPRPVVQKGISISIGL